MSKFRIDKPNSFAISLIRCPYFLGVASVCSLCFYGIYNNHLQNYFDSNNDKFKIMNDYNISINSILKTVVGLSLMSLYFLRKRIIKYVMERSLNGCKEIQKKEIKKFNPDIIIGSSWGGCVLLSLIHEKYWQSNSIALAPAYYRVMKATYHQSKNQNILNNHKINHLLDFGQLNVKNKQKKVKIIHGKYETTVPIEGSYELIKRNPDFFDLLALESKDHSLRLVVNDTNNPILINAILEMCQ